MYTANCYNVMIVSPSDVSEERDIVRQSLYQWNELNSRHRNIVFSVLGYDINAHADSGKHPQELLNHQLLEQADLIIAIFWTKLGSPTAEYSSGSVEEISRHIKRGKKALIYFSNKPVTPQDIDQEQYNKLQEYKESIRGKTFYKEFSSEGDFAQLLNKDIQSISYELHPNETNIDNTAKTSATDLSENEIDLLKIIKEKDCLQYLPMLGGININGYLIKDRRQLAEIDEVIEKLEQRDLIRATSSKRDLFDLTAQGYRICDTLPTS